ncbi:MBL fold metallo-hydrolase [Cohnella cholangitidis]|uniref:MBL fold metallo-hydrolase n=2 Tax=Cohnella cholangitidis TaxID=2598458 RepID=A0A7G5BY60_9BACL|nr:MBL fold metallo-hydrolase [Cohnella cholangitidis]QMV41894.1 MBL fold metallo-hydrolase [Cohnella cholangitidis]
MWITIGVIIVIIAIAYLALNYYPPLGGKASPESIRRMEESQNRSKGKFLNEIPTDMGMSMRESGKVLIDFVKGNPKGKPRTPIPIVRLTAEQLQSDGRHAKVTWFGHSAVLVRLDGKTIFIDPMLGRTPSPVPIFGGKRYSRQLPIEIDDLPAIDAVILSHDHYDHLDYGTIRKLKHKVKRFVVPLGVAGHLKRWGVEPGKITEHGWWEEFEFEGLKLATAPARHFSGRSIGDRNFSLWCSWVIMGKQAKIFFSGDSGYGPHFAQIGEKYGPFDLTFMECGQYDKRWSAIHMLPEETVQAHIDVKGNVLIPIHWGAFTLALHDWTDPIERASKAAKERDVALATPRIGEVVSIGAPDRPSDAWWRNAINQS